MPRLTSHERAMRGMFVVACLWIAMVMVVLGFAGWVIVMLLRHFGII